MGKVLVKGSLQKSKETVTIHYEKEHITETLDSLGS